MKKWFVVFVSFVFVVLCMFISSTDSRAEVFLSDGSEVIDEIDSDTVVLNTEVVPVDNSVETVDYLKNLYEGYNLITEEEYIYISEHLYEEATLDFLLRLFARIYYFDVNSDAQVDYLSFDTNIYCIERGIFDDCLENYEVPFTRGAFAHLLVLLLDNLIYEDYERLREINIVDEGFIPDVDSVYFYKDDIYQCYRYGLMLGVNDKGTFDTETPVTNYQVCVVLNRVFNPELRQILDYNTVR